MDLDNDIENDIELDQSQEDMLEEGSSSRR